MLNLTSDAVWKLRDYFHILSSEIMTEIQKEAPGVVVVVVVAAFFFVSSFPSSKGGRLSQNGQFVEELGCSALTSMGHLPEGIQANDWSIVSWLSWKSSCRADHWSPFFDTPKKAWFSMGSISFGSLTREKNTMTLG